MAAGTTILYHGPPQKPRSLNHEKIIIAIAATITLASAYCEHGTKIHEEYEGGHKVALYDFGQGRILKFNFPSRASTPYSIRYDFWKGSVCYN